MNFLINVLVAVLLAGGLTVVNTPEPAQAVTMSDRNIRPSRALSTARRYIGVPYRYGGSSPRGFDCSGYTKYVYKKIGVWLPRRASEQRRYTKRVRYPKPGDLTFFHKNGRVYHVGIYAGENYVYHAPRPGRRVARERIWTRQVSYGRP
jgi:cell wall-associated NlpC family hydrolase